MQILNISVNNRPSKSNSSKPYSVYLSESSGYSTAITDLSLPLITSESAGYTVSILDSIIREPRVHLPIQESTSHTANIMSLDITREVVYKKHSIGVDEADYSASILDAQITREVKYLKLSIDTDAVDYSTSIVDLQIM